MSNSTVLGAFALFAFSGAASADDQVYQAPHLAASLAGASGLIQSGSDYNMDLFYRSAYGYCDAKKVASVWNTDIASAKAIIGGKIANGLTDLVDADIASTAASVSCDWFELGFDYEHASALASYWNVSVDQAKATAGRMASSMGHKRFYESVEDVLLSAYGSDSPYAPDEPDYEQLFFQSAYGFCDARKVAHVWGIDVTSAKSVIGGKIANGLTDLVDTDIRSTASAVSCTWPETGLDYDDAQQLARFWGVSVGEAKTKAAMWTSQWGNKGFQDNLGQVYGTR